LREHGYDSVLFQSAEAFRNHGDFDQALCIGLNVNLNDASGLELRHALKPMEFLCRLFASTLTTIMPFAWQRWNQGVLPSSPSHFPQDR
jgi:FixJ family two-component response regulator